MIKLIPLYYLEKCLSNEIFEGGTISKVSIAKVSALKVDVAVVGVFLLQFMLCSKVVISN